MLLLLDDLGYRFPSSRSRPEETPLSHSACLDGGWARASAIGALCRPAFDVSWSTSSQVIGKLGLAGYFSIVWDIVRFCREQRHPRPGTRLRRRTARVCYSLGITAVDAVGMEPALRALSLAERGEWPDIDLDLPRGDRRARRDPVRLSPLRARTRARRRTDGGRGVR